MPTAIADIVDNSITAKAKNISLNFAWENGSPWLAIIDDGHGMDAQELINAMKFGSSNPRANRNIKDLGRFGLGMKTASFSQCRKLTVISKTNKKFYCCQWDLDEIARSTSEEWNLSIIDVSTGNGKIKELSESNLASIETGTIVLWEEIDRIDDQVTSQKQEQAFNRTMLEAREHLELVFHRFLSPERGHSKINLKINGSPIKGFDPFHSSSESTTELNQETIKCEGHEVIVQPFILPHHNKVPSTEYKRYAGKEGYLQNQGFYVYRNRRLIIRGTWFRLIKKADLTKLVRVKIDLPNSLDHLWRIDVKKSHAAPPESVRTQLKRIIEKISQAGKNVYKQKGRVLPSQEKHPVWNRRAVGNSIQYEINKTHPLINKIKDSMVPADQKLFDHTLTLFESNFPSARFFHDYAGSPEKLSTPDFEREEIETLLDTFVEMWALNENSDEQELKELLAISPFSRNRELTILILNERGLMR
ncbi:ATP-binding protein [Desulfovibrio sp. JC022]|uniref:ATP-binding protein n=1 Tax=Desulfovibrio sp. JC022 TaxID=2593642 RepID=UPI0013D6469F|nr:ATP-binding protein [Desulfovibrio sp. JC022]